MYFSSEQSQTMLKENNYDEDE